MQFDPNDGSSAGAALVPTDLDPNNQTRSDARRTYFDPYVSRPNFHVITGQHVTRVLIEGLGSNYEVSNPTPGGNENGNGMNGVTSNNGFGFGPGGSTPALDNTTTARLLRRQSPSTSNLRITGVEVSFEIPRRASLINITSLLLVPLILDERSPPPEKSSLRLAPCTQHNSCNSPVLGPRLC